MTAVLPNNSYYVSLDGSRRVTQRTRAHIKPIATFPLYADDASCVRLQPGASNDAAIVPGPRAFPVRVAADAPVEEKTPPLEPAHAPPVSIEDVKIERVVDRAPDRAASSSPVAGHRDQPLPVLRCREPALPRRLEESAIDRGPLRPL